MGDYGVLTQNRAKGALTFAGIFRVIDFALSNLVNSGVNKIGMIIQYLPGSLIEHVGSGHPWDLDNYGKHLKFMPPFVGLAETIWYNGTADAVYRNMNFVREEQAEHVIVLSGEHVFHVNFQDVLKQHIDKDADLTVISRELPKDQQSLRFGYVQVDEQGRITKYDEKPAHPPSNIAATGIYVFKASVLEELLAPQADARDRNLAKDILEPNAHRVKAYEYRTHECWEYMETVHDYYDVHYRLITDGSLEIMRKWNIMTNLKFRRVGHAPATSYGKNADVTKSLISCGCDIQGTVINSILSPGVKVAPGAVVANSIIMHDCIIGSDARLDHVISDRDALFGDGCSVGVPHNSHQANGTDQPKLTLIGKGAHLEAGVQITAGTQVEPRNVIAV